MKAVLISIRPKWCELIASGKKTIEVRKSKPKLETPFKVYIYMTAGDASYPVTINGAPYTCHNNGGMDVIGEFVCDTFIADKTFGHDALFNAAACMSDAEVAAYCTNNEMYGWHISDLKIYPYGKSLRDFSKVGFGEVVPLRRPPQSWMYVEEIAQMENGGARCD